MFISIIRKKRAVVEQAYFYCLAGSSVKIIFRRRPEIAAA